MEALEAVVGDHNTLDGRLEAAQADEEVISEYFKYFSNVLTVIAYSSFKIRCSYTTMQWEDVESLMKELKEFDGIQSVSKGRYFLSPGLAPTFQVIGSIIKAIEIVYFFPVLYTWNYWDSLHLLC